MIMSQMTFYDYRNSNLDKMVRLGPFPTRFHEEDGRVNHVFFMAKELRLASFKMFLSEAEFL